jgi:hypothetical protein
LLQAALFALVSSDGVLLGEDLWQRKLRGYRRHMAAQPDALHIVQLGSSRTLNALSGTDAEPWLSERLGRPVVLSNVGMGGAGPALTAINLRRLLNEGIRPDLLLIEVLPFGLDERHLSHEVRPENAPVAHLRLDEAVLLSRYAGSARQGLLLHWLGEQVVPAVTHRLALTTAAAPKLLLPELRRDRPFGLDERGHMALDPPPEHAARALAAMHETHAEFLTLFQLSPRCLSCVDETIREAQNAGLRVALVIMPEGPIMRRLYPPGLWERIEESVLGLARARGVPVLNFRESLPEEAFFDSHHVNPRGARAYSRALAERIVPLLDLGKGGVREGK